MPKHLAILFLLALLPAPVTASELPEIESDAFFQSLDDSLGYEEFRALDPDEQLRLRGVARQWLGISEDHVQASRGLGPRSRVRPGHQITMGDRQRSLVDALNAAATAAGYCPYMAEAWLQYAEVSNYLGDYKAAMACLAHAEKTIPYERSGDVQKRNQVRRHRIQASAAYNLDRFDEALESAEYVVEQDYNDWETRLLAARLMVQVGQFERARMMIAAFPSDSPKHATALGVLGVAELKAGDLEAAERAFDRAAEKGLRDPVFENDRGRLYLEMGDYDRAIRHFRRARELIPRFFEAASNIGVAQRRAGRLEESAATLTALIEEAPEYAPAHFNLAEVYRELAASSEGTEREQWARRAWRHYNLALEFGHDPESAISRRASLSVFVADLESAEEDLLALSGDPTASARVLTMLARVKKEQGRLDIAEQILLMATTRPDADALTWAELGEVRLRGQDFDGARVALQTARQLDQTLVVSRVNLSIAFAALGDSVSARAAVEEAARIAPDHPLVVEQRRKLGIGGSR